MGRLFGGGSSSAPPPPLPVAPTIDNSQAEIQAAQEAQLAKTTRGRASTILTGGQGVTSNAPTSYAKLLGMS